MTTPIDIINLGLSKISVSSVSNIDPPRTTLEKTCAANYPKWRDKQLAKRKWSFALYEDDLTLTATLTNNARLPYQFLLPNDCIRPLRDRLDGTTVRWERRGKYLYSDSDTLRLPYIRRVPENEFDIWFIDVLACWISVEMAETSTESNAKKTTAQNLYDYALREAGQANAYIIGEEDVTNDYDEGYSFVEARY